jgi:hypothetical protein
LWYSLATFDLRRHSKMLAAARARKLATIAMLFVRTADVCPRSGGTPDDLERRDVVRGTREERRGCLPA